MKFLFIPMLFLVVVHLSQGVPLRLQKRAAFYIANETACVVDHTVYLNGDPIPTDDPCEACKCRPPGFACVLKECVVKPGCRAIRRAGHCCPDYDCGEDDSSVEVLIDIEDTSSSEESKELQTPEPTEGYLEPEVVANEAPQDETSEEDVRKETSEAENIIIESAIDENDRVETFETENNLIETSEAENDRIETVAPENVLVETDEQENGGIETSNTENARIETAAADNGRSETDEQENGGIETTEAENHRIETAAPENDRIETAELENGRTETFKAEEVETKTDAEDRAEKPESENVRIESSELVPPENVKPVTIKSETQADESTVNVQTTTQSVADFGSNETTKPLVKTERAYKTYEEELEEFIRQEFDEMNKRDSDNLPKGLGVINIPDGPLPQSLKTTAEYTIKIIALPDEETQSNQTKIPTDSSELLVTDNTKKFRSLENEPLQEQKESASPIIPEQIENNKEEIVNKTASPGEAKLDTISTTTSDTEPVTSDQISHSDNLYYNSDEKTSEQQSTTVEADTKEQQSSNGEEIKASSPTEETLSSTSTGLEDDHTKETVKTETSRQATENVNSSEITDTTAISPTPVAYESKQLGKQTEIEVSSSQDSTDSTTTTDEKYTEETAKE